MKRMDIITGRKKAIGAKMKNHVVEEYKRLAPHYDRRWTFFNEATLRETLHRLDLKKAEKLLDIGCGTGSLLQAIYRQCPSIDLTGVDVSQEMLEAARRKVGTSARLRLADVRHLPFGNDTFDTVVSCNSFHYWCEPEAGLREISRVLKPSGAVVITDWCHDYLTCRILDLCLSIFDRAHFKAYGQDRCRRFLQEAGFDTAKIERYKIDWLWGIMTAKAVLSQPAG